MNTVTPISEASAELARILDAYLAARQAGQNPSKQALLAEHPHLAEELEDCLASLEFIGTAVSPTAAENVADVGAGALPPTAEPIGDFRLVREIGRGGMGVVYEAVQLSLGRRVALKVLPFAAVLDPSQVKRFKNEAQAAASLDHPHIVSVYSVGCERGIHYYAMQYVEGQSLAEVVEQLKGDCPNYAQQNGTVPLAPALPSDTVRVAALSTLNTNSPRERYRQIARLGIQAAEALQYAHEMGIVHRDIKPSNLLVDAHGHLWITDFGLATTQTDAGLTMTGDLLGTLRYMSPEQAAGDRPRIDYRTDIYSLGVTLYELLAGQPAFADTDRKILFRRIIEEEPKPLRSIDAAIPRDLETIVLKAIEKDPHTRYDSATELAADLERFCDDQPIRARRTSRVERLWRWSRRNRVVAALSLVVATLVALVAITAPMIAWRQARLIDTTQKQLYAKDVSIGYTAWNDGDLGQVQQLLDRYAAGTDAAHYREFAWRYLEGLYQRATASFLAGGKIALSRSTNLLAVARPDDFIYLFDTNDWAEVGKLPWRFTMGGGLHFSSDGRFLAANYPDATLSVWEVPTRKHLYAIAADSHHIEACGPSFSPDGSIMATGGQDPEVKIWETTTRKLKRKLPGHRDDVSAVAFSPDGKTLATASYDHSLRFWDTDTWTARKVIENAFPDRVNGLAYDPTGTRLASGGYGKEIKIWNSSGQMIATLPSSGSSLHFSPDGRLLAIGGGLKGTVKVWDVEQGELINDYLVGHSAAQVAFLSNEELLCEADFKLMRRKVGRRTEPVTNGNDQVTSEAISIDISASGELLVACYGRYEADPGEGAIACWDLRRGIQQLLPGHDGSSVFDVAIDPTGEWIVAGGGPRLGPGFVKIWSARGGGLPFALPEQDLCVGDVAVSPVGGRLAIAALRHVSVYDDFPRQPTLLNKIEMRGALRVAFARDGDTLAVGCFEMRPDVVTIWDPQTGEKLDTASYNRPIMDVAFSPDGGLLASIDWFGKVEVYDRYEKRIVLSEPAHQWIGMSVAFSPDGQTLATGSTSGDVKLWHLPTMMQITTFRTRSGVAELAFFPDGRALAVGYTDRTIELWHVDQEKELLRIDGAVESK